MSFCEHTYFYFYCNASTKVELKSHFPSLIYGGPVAHNTTKLAQHNGNKPQHNKISTRKLN